MTIKQSKPKTAEIRIAMTPDEAMAIYLLLADPESYHTSEDSEIKKEFIEELGRALDVE